MIKLCQFYCRICVTKSGYSTF